MAASKWNRTNPRKSLPVYNIHVILLGNRSPNCPLAASKCISSSCNVIVINISLWTQLPPLVSFQAIWLHFGQTRMPKTICLIIVQPWNQNVGNPLVLVNHWRRTVSLDAWVVVQSDGRSLETRRLFLVRGWGCRKSCSCCRAIIHLKEYNNEPYQRQVRNKRHSFPHFRQ